MNPDRCSWELGDPMSDFEMAAEWYFREPCGRAGLVDRFLTVKLGRSEQPLHTPECYSPRDGEGT
jgi:hypothetical protein